VRLKSTRRAAYLTLGILPEGLIGCNDLGAAFRGTFAKYSCARVALLAPLC
jgi:hypothetical protein